jgi:hypothetical protein
MMYAGDSFYVEESRLEAAGLVPRRLPHLSIGR